MNDLQRRLRLAVREGTMITIILEPKRIEFNVHKKLLDYASRYFRHALNVSWNGATECTIRIKNIDDDVFDAFVTWMYSEVLPNEVPNSKGVTVDSFNQWQILMVKLYVLAGHFEAPRFKFAVLKLQVSNLLCHSNIHPPHSEAINVAFENLPRGDILLQLYTDVHAMDYKYTYENEARLNAERLPRDFLVSVMMRYSTMLGSARPKLNIEDYIGTEA